PFVAPEIFDGKTPTKESDVYSFGMVMWMLSAAICDDPDLVSDLSNQFDAAEETNFSNLKNSKFNTFASHEKAFYFSRPLLDC
ncbi:4370_t:CDS:2, partial [Rhizophagus irregularis]